MLHHTRSSLALGGLAAVALLLPAAPTAPAIGARRASTAGTVGVQIKNFAFAPRTVRIKVGATVVWTNMDANVGHTITSGKNADAHAWKSSPLIYQGQHVAVTFHTPGTYPYYCMPHYYNPAMHGVVIVTR